MTDFDRAVINAKPRPEIVRYERALSRTRIALAAGIASLFIVLVLQ